MWAFGCGVVSAGVPMSGRWGVALAGVALAGPLVCGTSQAANDWFDRHVDAINEPGRPIPSGRLPGRTGLVDRAGLDGVVPGRRDVARDAGLGAAVLGWAWPGPTARRRCG